MSCPARRVAALALGLVATPVWASFNGPLNLGYGGMFVGGLVVCVPGGLACFLLEWLCSRRQPPKWVGKAALTLGIASQVALLIAPLDGIAGTLLYLLPPVMTLALVTLLPAPAWRLLAVWAVSLGSIALLVAFAPVDATGPRNRDEELLGALTGGAVTHMALWHLGFLLGQIGRRRAGVAAAHSPDWRAIRDHAAEGLQAIDAAHRPQIATHIFSHPGFYWWLGGTAMFYVATMGMALFKWDGLLNAALLTEWRLLELLGLPFDFNRQPSALRQWATHGLVWSAVFGAGTWGLAAAAGRFDAGRLAPLRLAAIVLAACMLLWLMQPGAILRY